MIAPNDTNRANLVLMDIGNTNVSMVARIDARQGEVSQVPGSDADALFNELRALWDALPQSAPRFVVICSVCPPVLEQVERECADGGIEPVLVIGRDLDRPIGIDLREPEKVGIDRICAAAGAYARVKSACVIADFGTALTIDLVADNGVFLGGMILPGLATSARALHRDASLLPLVTIRPPTERIGKDTVNAINNGIFYMMCGALREIVERYATDIGRWPPLVVTGGDAAMITEACEFVDLLVPDLCLEGAALAYDLAVQRDDDE